MRNRPLHDALSAFVEEAAAQLRADKDGGAEVPFELVEGPGRRRGRSPLYCYRPLTDEFIRGRADALTRLPTHPAAARALEAAGGGEPYLRVIGESAEQGDPESAALRALVTRVFEDSTEFAFDPQRFERAYAELERTLLESRTLGQVAAPVRGLALVSPEVALGEGLSLVRADALVDPPAEVARLARGEHGGADAVAVLTSDLAPGEGPPVTSARVRLRKLVCALRLFEPGSFAVGPAAWARMDAGAWQLVSLGSSGRTVGDLRLVEPEHEDELRAFCNLIARRAGSAEGRLAWALGRFEMGAERLSAFEALTDYLLALRALLEPEGAGSGQLARRLAALCALPERRVELAERVAHAISLERAVIDGLPPAEPGADALVDEVADHLRALLRDVLCGHLEGDLVRVADEVLFGAQPKVERRPAEAVGVEP